MNSTIQAAYDAALPELNVLLDQSKVSFQATWGNFTDQLHKERLGILFKSAGQVKLKLLVAKDAAEVAELQDTYDTLLASIETLGLATRIVGEATAANLVKENMHSWLSSLGSVAGIVLKAAVSSAIPGGGVVTTLASAGIDALVKNLPQKAV